MQPIKIKWVLAHEPIDIFIRAAEKFIEVLVSQRWLHEHEALSKHFFCELGNDQVAATGCGPHELCNLITRRFQQQRNFIAR